MGTTHTHRGRRNGGRHNRDNQGNQNNQGNQGNQGGGRGPAPSGARSAGAPERSGTMNGPIRPDTEPRDPTIRHPRPGERPAERNGRGAAAAAAERFAVVAPIPYGEPRPLPPVIPPAPPAPAHQGRHAPGAPGSPRPGIPDARPTGFARQEPGEPRSMDANGSTSAESNGHRPPFAVIAPAQLNGVADGAEPQGWVPRVERGDRAERQDRTDRPPLRPGVRSDVGPLIESLHEIFERDRATASQGNAARCGICYLHFARAELEYREAEGFYVCPECAALLGTVELNMVRRQQK